MHINRLFGIVYILLDKKSVTAGELAEHFEVSKRTILRDTEALAAAGIPVYTTRGKGGGISLSDGFVLNKTVITEKEQDYILSALKSLSVFGQSDAGEVLLRLESLFRKSNSDWIEADFSRWGHGSKDNQRFNLLKDAVLTRTVVNFEYVSSSGIGSRRSAYPLKIVFKSKSWYVQCFCLQKQDYRTFRLNRMLGTKQLDEHFPAGRFIPPPIESYDISAETLVPIELKFSPHLAFRVYDEFDEDCIKLQEDGFLYVSAVIPEDGWLYGFLMSFGRNVQVLSPSHVRENLSKMLKET